MPTNHSSFNPGPNPPSKKFNFLWWQIIPYLGTSLITFVIHFYLSLHRRQIATVLAPRLLIITALFGGLYYSSLQFFSFQNSFREQISLAQINFSPQLAQVEASSLSSFSFESKKATSLPSLFEDSQLIPLSPTQLSTRLNQNLQLLTQQPHHQSLLLDTALLYYQLQDYNSYQEYLNQAQLLNPNSQNLNSTSSASNSRLGSEV